MITNERQYRITKGQLKKLQEALDELAAQDSSDELAALSVEALKSEVDILQSEVADYEELRRGSSETMSVSSLGELPRALIRARIARGMTQRALADALGFKEQQIQRYEATEYASASLRRLQEIASLVGVEMTLETKIRSTTARLSEGELEELDWSKYPIKEMYRRHWFKGFQGPLDAAIAASDTLVGDYVRRVIRRPELVLHRKHVRAGSRPNNCALIAWESRILHLAEETPPKAEYVHGSITDSQLVAIVRLSRYDDGPLRAKAALAELGISMVVEPHLPGTHLDGASFLVGDHAVIGLTLRYDRLDNFWFVLLHEVAHVMRHLGKGRLTGTFDDLDAEGDDRIEREADSVSAEALLPSSWWDSAVARYVRSPEAVLSFAEEHGISPAIVAGRIRYEANDYLILSNLLGNGQARRLFADVDFNV